MKILKKIKKWFSTEERCHICGKEIKASRNPESIKIVLGYSEMEYFNVDVGKKEQKLPWKFYLCKQHREDFENFILTLKKENLSNYKENRKKPIKMVEDVSMVIKSVDGSPLLNSQTTYDDWMAKPNLDKGILEFEVNSEKVEMDEKPNPMVNAKLSYATFQNEQKESKNEEFEFELFNSITREKIDTKITQSESEKENNLMMEKERQLHELQLKDLKWRDYIFNENALQISEWSFFQGDEDTRLYYHIHNGNLFFCAIEWCGITVDEPYWGSNTLIKILYMSIGFYDGLRHTYFGDPRGGYLFHMDADVLGQLLKETDRIFRLYEKMDVEEPTNEMLTSLIKKGDEKEE